MNKRLNNFEALRIFAMFMVITLHYLSKGGILTSATTEFSTASYVVWLIEAFAVVAVNVYVLITGYFLCESNMKPKRLLEIVCQVLWYTILIPVVLLLLGVVTPQNFDMYDLLRFVFPAHMKHYWFVTAYVILMLLVPFLNAGIQHMSREQLTFSTVLLVVYNTLPKSVLPVKFTDDEAGNHVLWLVCLYLIAAYIRKYGIPFFSSLKKSLLCYVVGALAIFGSLLIMRVIYFKLDAFEEGLNFGYHYNHILCLFASVALFYVFKYWEFKDSVASRFIGKVAPYTFGVYLLHEHLFVRDLWPKWLCVEATENIIMLLFDLVWKVSLVLIVGLVLDWLRGLVFKGIGKLLGRYRRIN